jgi:GT2 family glycosyltransferase
MNYVQAPRSGAGGKPSFAATLCLGPNDQAPWASFDAAWYGRTYQVAGNVATASPERLLALYIARGQGLGHSPNPLFSEAWYRKTHPELAAAIEAGQYLSGFEHYCLVGYLDESPHWLFDAGAYRAAHSDLTPESMASNGMLNHYAHFLKYGTFEGRIAHPFFWSHLYLAGLPSEQRQDAQVLGPYQHFLRSPRPAGLEPRTTPYFSPAWYLSTYADVSAKIAEGECESALHHYLTNHEPTQFDPLPIFSERTYLMRNSDVARAVEAGKIRCGYHHFIADGVKERRVFSRSIDLDSYVATHAIVRADLADDTKLDPFLHLLTIGTTLGLAAGLDTLPGRERTPETQAKTLFTDDAEVVALLHARHPIDFTMTGRPDVSVIMVAHNRFALTLAALASLRATYAGAIELILVDSGSTDEVVSLSRYVVGAKLLRFDANVGFVIACNAALGEATAETVIYLNNDTRLAPRAITAALERMASSSHVGAIGGKIIRAHGRLQEAGCILWRDGGTSGYLRDHCPLEPQANFVRDVDFCSGVFLAVPTVLARALGGFDVDYAPSYYEDVDLCIRIAQLGFRVIYDPGIVVYHLEYGSARDTDEVDIAIALGRERFLLKHMAIAATRCDRLSDPEAKARSTDSDRHRVLFIDDTIPVRDLGSGFARANDIITEMVALGLSVSVFPINASKTPIVSAFAGFPDTVEILHDQSIDGLKEFLSERPRYFGSVWVSRTHNLERVRDTLDGVTSADGQHLRVILDTEAIATMRNHLRSKITAPQESFDLATALNAELQSAAGADRIVCVSEPERGILTRMGISNVSVLGHCRDIRLTPRPFEERAGMLVLGAIHDHDSPNYDGLRWLVDDVLPLVEAEVGAGLRLTVAGYTAAGVSLAKFSGDPRIIFRGYVPDTWLLYDAHRIFLAPTRYAAGIPYKVHEASSFGLPVVATSLLADQMGWSDGDELLVADADDPAAFARQIVRLNREPALWHDLRASATRRLRRDQGRPAYRESIRSVVLGEAVPAMG